MDFKSRLLQFIKASRLTIAEFERRVGLSNGYVKNFKSTMRQGKLEALFATFPELNRVWLLTGEGEMLNHVPAASGAIPADIPAAGETPREFFVAAAEVPSGTAPHLNVPRDGCYVPLYNIDSVGGMSMHNIFTASEEFVRSLVPFPQARPGDIAIIESGDSMSPVLNPGCYLLLRPVENWREYFGFGHVFVLLLSDGRRITKRIMRYDPDPANYILCCSENERYPEEELPKSLIMAVWRVVSAVNNL